MNDKILTDLVPCSSTSISLPEKQGETAGYFDILKIETSYVVVSVFIVKDEEE
jgi:hypothetical protein